MNVGRDKGKFSPEMEVTVVYNNKNSGQYQLCNTAVFYSFFSLYFLPKLQVDLGEENHANEALRDIVTSEVHFKDEVLKVLQK